MLGGWAACLLALWRTDYDPTLWWKVERLERRLNGAAAEALFLQHYAERLTHAVMQYPRDSIFRVQINNCLLQVEDW